MNNKELVAELSRRIGQKSSVTQRMLNSILGAMGDAFQEGDPVQIMNFGTFEVKKKMERIITNPVTGQRMLVPPKLVLSFKPNSSLKDNVRKGGDE